MQYISIKKEEWDKTLEHLLLSSTIFASTENDFGKDYELITRENISEISYNIPKPATPLKSFFLPHKENVTSGKGRPEPRIIIGIPNCDIEALSLLDEIYLDKEFTDIFYRSRRENTILIASDCFTVQEHCHCLSYGINPYTLKSADLAILKMDEMIILRVLSGKGEDFIKRISSFQTLEESKIISEIEEKHHATEALLNSSDKKLPDYTKTGKIVAVAKNDIWGKYSSKCVSCGACTTICPTCTCFLLIDKPGFEKIKQLDACQYPGFERVAGGEDVLFELHNRFRNRYMCKYVWKPLKFDTLACTGCGRCIEACIGKINKNELFMEFAE